MENKLYAVKVKFGSDFQEQIWSTIFERYIQTMAREFEKYHRDNSVHVIQRNDEGTKDIIIY